jgi:hypothetical protein
MKRALPRRDRSGTPHTVTLSEVKGTMLEMVPFTSFRVTYY